MHNIKIFIFSLLTIFSFDIIVFASAPIQLTSYADIIEAVKLEMNGGISAYGSMIFDVTNTTTHKVRFKTNIANSGDQVQGNTARNLTYFTFTRMGDT